MNVDVLIVSSLYDFSTDLVAQELEARNVSYLRLNKEYFPNYRLTLDIDNKLLEVIIDEKKYRVTDDISAIYYRQPIFLRNTPNDSLTIDEQLNRSQWMGFLRSLTIFSKASWLNRLDATYLAETKAYQLCIANDIGFTTPKTLIGNNSNRFQEFREEVIIKSLDTILLREAEDCLFTYSTVKSTKELNDENVASTPLTVQAYVSPKIDVRVTVIGDKIYAVKITSLGKGIKEDWRTVDREKVEYNDIQLPKEIENYCFKLVKHLNLSFGAIDLVISGEDYIFIEINPTGEWGWLVNSKRRFDKYIVSWLMGAR